MARRSAEGVVDPFQDRPLLLYRPCFQSPGRIPEHPLVATGGDEGCLDAGLLEGVELFAHLVGEIQDSFDEYAKLLAAVGIYPPLVAGVRGAAFEEGFADLPVDPVAWQ